MPRYFGGRAGGEQAVKFKPDFTRVRNFLQAHTRLCAICALGVCLMALGAGGFFFYRYRTGPDYAFKMLHKALADGDTAVPAKMIDFSALSDDIVRAVLTVQPSPAASEADKAEMRDEAQRLVLRSLAHARVSGGGGGGHGESGGEHGGGGKGSPPPPRKMHDPVPALPEDAVAQLAAGLKPEKTREGVVLRGVFTNNVLHTEFPVRLLMERRNGGWAVTRLLNAVELAELYKSARDALKAEDEAALAEKNEKIFEEMRPYFEAPACAVSVGVLSDKVEALMLIKATAKNSGAETLQNVNMLCSVTDAAGNTLFERQLNAVRRVFPGRMFENSWTVSLDAAAPATQALLNAGPLSCTVRPLVMTLGNGKLLYPRNE